jgi:hypothetical protein
VLNRLALPLWACAALAGCALAGVASAGGGGNPMNGSKPTWWPKLQHVSTSGFLANVASSTTSISVGANIDVSNEVGPQSETSIATKPSNTRIVVAGSNEIDRLPMRGYFSSDGGKTYGGIDLPLPPATKANGFDFGSDPGVAWDPFGNCYYSYIVVFFSSGGAVVGSELAVARTSDNGLTWTPTYFNFENGGAKFNDKPMIAVDNNPGSPHFGTIYVAWDTTNGTQGKPSTTGVVVSHSTDRGVSFSPPVFASDTNGGPHFGIGADPFVAADGAVHVAWHDQSNAIVESSSTDGGNSFGATHLIASTIVPLDVAAPAESTRRVLVYPSCDSDRSTGPNRGALYCVWEDETTTGDGLDVFSSRSTDGGVSWSAPLRVNDDAHGLENDQFYQWLSIDPSNGSLNVSFYDTRLDPTHLSTNVFYTRSTDGGLSFAPNVRVTDASTNETCCGAQLGDQYGDYEGISAVNGVVRPIWTDRRVSVQALNEEIFSATITTR